MLSMEVNMGVQKSRKTTMFTNDHVVHIIIISSQLITNEFLMTFQHVCLSVCLLKKSKTPAYILYPDHITAVRPVYN